MKQSCVTSETPKRLLAVFLATTVLAGCEEGQQLGFLQPKDTAVSTSSTSTSTKLVERDVEAPDVFQVTEPGLWDGRPSLGGIWVAHPDVTEPERVIIRNTTNGNFVIGALFRRERDIPGPRLQASSDAASALGMLAGAPVDLNVTALRRETVQEGPAEGEDTASLEDSGEISETTLDPIAGAAAAIDASAPGSASAGSASAGPVAPVQTKDKPIGSTLAKPYVQLGIFSVEANATRTANQMRSAGMVPTVFNETINGKPFWRVVVGPAQSKSERAALLREAKATGFSDAYSVAN